MFKVTLKDGSTLKNVFNCLKGMFEEVTLEVTATEATFQAIDSNSIMLMELRMKNDEFNKFSADKRTTICLSFQQLSKILNDVNEGDSLTMKAKAESKKLTVSLSNTGN